CGMIYQDKLVGNISFNSINHQLKKVEIGYWLSSEYQGKGIVSKSVSKLVDLAFTELDMEKDLLLIVDIHVQTKSYRKPEIINQQNTHIPI
ncbi:GNAT family N-acetyltransferase, partial [Vibrio metschnikovii]|uniref:GNAT family N-acetyltransferase n=1 Tax=Vibrio metschnikovii TaxID=28172 RepID=UPI002FC643D1